MIGIIDYGLGNVQSISNALDSLNIQNIIINHPEQLPLVDKLILPGVGSFKQGMENLEKRHLKEALIKEVLIDKKPILGICLGMQLFAFEGYEGGHTFGLGFLPSKVIRMPSRRLPHVGWDDIILKTSQSVPLLNHLPLATDVYFTHSYYMDCMSQKAVIAEFEYEGERFAAAVQYNNIFGVQFHPEKSQKAGLKMLQNFAELKC